MRVLLRHSPLLAVQQNILHGFHLSSKRGFMISRLHWLGVFNLDLSALQKAQVLGIAQTDGLLINNGGRNVADLLKRMDSF